MHNAVLIDLMLFSSAHYAISIFPSQFMYRSRDIENGKNYGATEVQRRRKYRVKSCSAPAICSAFYSNRYILLYTYVVNISALLVSHRHQIQFSIFACAQYYLCTRIVYYLAILLILEIAFSYTVTSEHRMVNIETDAELCTGNRI